MGSGNEEPENDLHSGYNKTTESAVAEEYAGRQTTSVDHKIQKVLQQSSLSLPNSTDFESNKQEDYKPEEGDDDDEHDAVESDDHVFVAAEGVSNQAESFLELNLSKPLLRACEELGYSKPTPIQAACIPPAMAGRDICASAIPDSGKTAAYSLLTLESLLNHPKRVPAIRVLILTPTRELAIQLHSMMEKLAQYTDIKCCLIVGGLSDKVQETALTSTPDVVVATPGHMINHLHNSVSLDLDDLSFLVLDEADRLLEPGFNAEIQELIHRCSKRRQTILFSATMTEEVAEIVRLSLKKPLRLSADPSYQPPAALTEEVVRIKNMCEAHYEAVLLALCSKTFTSKVIIFSGTKLAAHRLKILFGLAGLKAAEIHNHLTQAQRLNSLELFKKEEADFLITTDVAVRGLDIAGVRIVINYDCPHDFTTYVHRLDLTAREGQEGYAVTFVTDNNLSLLRVITKKAGSRLKSRIVVEESINKWAQTIEQMEDQVATILREEKVEMALIKTEMEASKDESMIEHRDETFSQPKKTWFITENEKNLMTKEVKVLSLENSEVLKPEPLAEDAKQESNCESSDGSGNMNVTFAPGVSDSKDICVRNDAKAAEEAFAKPANGAYDIKNESSMKVMPSCDTDRSVEESNNVMDDSMQDGMEQGDSSVLKESKNLATNISSLEDLDDHSELKRYRQSERRYLGSSCGFANLTKNNKTTDIIRQTRDMDLEGGTVDALEVARLVAKEVEREVVGYYEQSGSSASSSSSSSSSTSSSSSSSSDRVSGGGSRPQGSPKSANAKQDLQIDGPTNQLSATENAPDASGKVPVKSLTNVETKNHTQDAESSLVTEVAQEPESNTEKNIWEFDLNQEFSSEDADHQLDTSSNPVSVVSASRAVVASGMPAGPLQFEGSLGWKGSAATSAFRPASPRWASDSDKALSGGGTSSGSRQRQDFLDFDLNVVEHGDDKIVNPVLSIPKQFLPSLPSGESSVELSPKRSQRLKLDLNQTQDDGGLPACDWKMGGLIFQPQICQRSPSPASSSSCMQPSMNFDLNDNLFNCNDSSDPLVFLGESSRKVNPCMGPPDETVVSIMGTKVKRNAFPPQTPLPFVNERALEPAIDANLLRGGQFMGLGPAVPYPQSVYGYNGLAMGPAVSLASANIYRPGGPIPYVFDSRGAPFLPRMMGSASSVPSTYCQSPLVMNMMGATAGPTHASPLRPTFDLNSGFGNAVEAGNPDASFFRPIFIPHAQGRPSEEQLRESYRPLSSGNNGGKRKEPDSGWELYSTNNKHQQPPHL